MAAGVREEVATGRAVFASSASMARLQARAKEGEYLEALAK